MNTMKKLIYSVLAVLIFSVACNNGSSSQDETNTNMNHEENVQGHSRSGMSQNNMPDETSGTMDTNVKAITVKRPAKASAIVDAYLDIKNADRKSTRLNSSHVAISYA